MKPLTDLLKDEVPVSELLTSTTTTAIDCLKTCLINQPVLAMPDYNLPFRLVTDASRIGVAGILE